MKRLAICALAVVSLNINAYPIGLSKIDMEGEFLVLANVLEQANRVDETARRNQFDFAANLRFEWRFHPKVSGLLQFQGGAGGGSLGFADNQVTIADIALTYNPADRIAFTFGSFAPPFGRQTQFLTDNALSFGNPFFINSLFYSAFAGSDVRARRAVGMMGELDAGPLDFTAAIMNGTEQSALNTDGAFGFAGKVGLELLTGFILTGSYMKSDDSAESGATGFNADFSGKMLEAFIEPVKWLAVKGFAGMVEFGDGDDATEDEVLVWMGEIRINLPRWYVAARLSGWYPEDDNGDIIGISSRIPSIGFALSQPNEPVVKDQRVHRFQAGLGWNLSENLLLKGEWFIDSYEYRTNLNNNSDVWGVIVGLNAGFKNLFFGVKDADDQ